MNCDNLLYDMFCESNEDVRNALYEKYSPLISYLVKKYSMKAMKLGLDMKDLMQEANLAFTDALNSYNPNKDASLKTFISICIERRLIKIINKNSTSKSLLDKGALSLDFEYGEEGGKLKDYIADSTLDPSLSFLEKEKLDDLKEKIEKDLSDFELAVYKYLLLGFNYQKIAIVLDKNPKQIDNTIQRIRFKMRHIMEVDRNV